MFTKKILLVDQEPRVTLLVRQALERTGRYSIKEEPLGELALSSARSFRPDLILVDLIANGADGDIMVRQFQADPVLRDIPVVCLSSRRSAEEVGSSGTLDGYSFFVTPLRIEELVRGVEEFFSA